MWVNNFKIALVQKDTETLDKLIGEIPKFENIEDAKQASFLLKEALTLLFTLKDDTVSSMKQIKQNIKFLQSSLSDSTGTLNIRS